jgi:hypothetical protein
MKRYLERIATSTVFLGVIAGLLLYALAGFGLAPYLLKRYVPTYAQEQLGTRATIADVRFNPFLLRLEVKGLRLEYPPGQPLVGVGRLLADFQLSSLFRRAWTFADVQIDGLDLNLEVQRDGSLNLAAFMDRLAKRYAAVSSGERPPRRWLLQHAQLRDGRLTFSDLSGQTPLRTAFVPINLEVLNLATLPDRHGRYAITAAVPDGGTITWHGDVSLLPMASAGELEVRGVKLATAWAFVRDELQLAEPSGSVDLATRYRFAYEDRQAALGLEDIRAEVSALALRPRGGGDPILVLDTIAASGARFDLASRALVVPSIEVADGRVAVIRGVDGRIPLLEGLTQIGKPSRESRAPAPATPPWKVFVETVKARDVQVALGDRGQGQPITYDAHVISATVRNVTNDGKKAPIRFEAALRVAQGGTVDGSGTIAQNLDAIEAQVEMSQVALAPLRPLLARYATLDLRSGHLSASARVGYQARGEGPALRATGAITIGNLLMNESNTGDRFLSWKTLSTDDMTLTLAPTRLRIKEVRVTEPGAKVLIAKDRSLNLVHVLRTETGRTAPVGTADGARDVAAAAPGPQRPESRRDAFDARVARVSVQDGTVDFADLSLVLPFSTRITRFSGTAVGISTERTGRTEVKFRGRIEPSGFANVEGGLSAYDPKAFTDIRVKFHNVEMPPLSPYTATFAGRAVAAGRLSLELQYKVVDRALVGQNKAVMENFKLGERVEAPNALDLPLDLAIALLTDSQGRITVAVPIQGNVGQPTFDYRHLLREAIGNLIRRVVSAPFRALGRLFGGVDEEVGSIDFTPGSARLRPPEREKLDTVAHVLSERRELKLVIRGPFDPERDGEALRSDGVRRDVAHALGVKLDGPEGPGPIAYSDAATQRALEALLAARAGPKGMEELAHTFTRRAGREPDRVNPVLALLGRASPDREFYQAVYRRLVEVYPLPPNALPELAARRARAIVEYVAGSASIEPSQVDSGEVRAVNATGDQPVTAQLALDVVETSRDATAASQGGLDSSAATPTPSIREPTERVGRGANGRANPVNDTAAPSADPSWRP